MINNFRKGIFSSSIASFFMSISFAAFAQSSDEIGLAFGSAVEDSEVSRLLEMHSLTPMKAHIWVSGFSGSHSHNLRPEEMPLSQAEFVSQARNQMISYFNKSLEGNAFRLQGILKSYSEADIVAEEDINESIRQLLELRSQFLDALGKLSDSAPIIYGVTVTGTPEDKNLVSRDQLIKGVIGEEAIFQNTSIGSLLRPVSYTNEYTDIIVKNLSNQKVYDSAFVVANDSKGVK